MKTFLRNKVTGQYFQGLDNWSVRLEQAFNFRWPERVVKFVRAADLKVEDMEVVLGFDNPRHNIFLPIDERFGAVSVRPGEPLPRRKSAPPLPAQSPPVSNGTAAPSLVLLAQE